MSEFSLVRRNMVDNQLRPTRVTDQFILEAMSVIPRERFVPENKKSMAYIDEDIEVAPGRFLMEPIVLARLLQELELTSNKSVLNVGCATGYDAAVLGKLVGSVVAIESDPALMAFASEAINELAIDNVAVVEAPLDEGYQAESPYDAILISGAITEVPSKKANELILDGRLAAVIGNSDVGVLGRAYIFVRGDDTLSSRPLFDAGTQMLPGLEKEETFTF